MESDRSIQSAFDLYQSGKFEEAESIVRKVLKGNPDNSDVLHLLGLIFYKRGDYDRALRHIRKALRLDPNYADAYYDLGNILHDKGQIAKALTNYRKAIKLNPSFVEAYNNLGIAFQDNAQPEKAIDAYKKALNIDPNYAEAHNNLGMAFQEKGRLDKAITHFQRALLLRPDYASSYNNLVDAVQSKGGEAKQESGKHILYAIYRCTYGADFIQESIRSITDYADKIFVFVDRNPWGDSDECVYKGETIKFPKTIGDVVEKIKGLNNSKIEVIFDHQDGPDNQVTHYVNDIILPNHEKPSTIISLEVDHVFRNEELRKALDEFAESGYIFATTNQIEIWKGLRHRVPDRPNRVGAVLCNLSKLDKMPETMKHGGILVMPKLSAYVHNLSFAVSAEVMYWRHLLAITLAQKTGEVAPFENWYEDKWLKWDYQSNNDNLGVSDQFKIEQAIPYDVNELPDLIKEKIL